MILHLYMARKALVNVAMVWGAFTIIIVLVEFMEQLGQAANRDLGIWDIAYLVALQTPGSFYQVLPLVFVLAALSLFLGLGRSSELTVTRAVGRSGIRALWGPLAVGFVLGILSVAFLNPIVAVTSKTYETARAELAGRSVNALSITREGLWLRQTGTDGHIVIHATRANAKGTVLFDVTLHGIAQDGHALWRKQVTRAVLSDGYWDLHNVTHWPLEHSLNPQADQTSYDLEKIPTDLTLNHIQDSFGAPAEISIWALPSFIEQLERAGFSAKRHRVWFHMEMAQPIFLMTLIMMGAGFTMRHARIQNTGAKVLMAILAGFGLFFLRNFAQILGDNGQLSPVWAAWVPPFAALGLALALLLHTEDG